MSELRPIAGSFRDPAARVYVDGDRILRGVDAATLDNFRSLLDADFFRDELERGRIVGTRVADDHDPLSVAIRAQGWAGALEHDRLPLLSYAYEWSFSMLKDAALLHLDLLERALGAGWIIKDSTPYNIQFVGASPVFIDIPSFVPRAKGDYWRGYRQFCMLFLYPLMLTGYRGVPFQPLLRSSLDGIAPADMARFFSALGKLRKGVLSHVQLPAALERRVVGGRGPAAAGSPRPQSDAMVLGLVQSMRRIVSAIRTPVHKTLWSDYTDTHSYDPESLEEKIAFVGQAGSQQPGRIAWDLGSNTGKFSELLEASSDHVVSVDSDHECVERLYLRLRERSDRKILPLVMNLANPSPDQGWAGAERLAFDKRNRPDLVLGLAVIHHVCLGSNVPIPDFLDWLAATGARLIIEFVDRNDAMVRAMIERKTEPHEAYNLATFEQELRRRYEIVRSAPLKGGDRTIYHCAPRR